MFCLTCTGTGEVLVGSIAKSGRRLGERRHDKRGSIQYRLMLEPCADDTPPAMTPYSASLGLPRCFVVLCIVSSSSGARLCDHGGHVSEVACQRGSHRLRGRDRGDCRGHAAAPGCRWVTETGEAKPQDSSGNFYGDYKMSPPPKQK